MHSQHWTVKGNTFAGSGPDEMLAGGWGISRSAWSLIADTLSLRGNHWYHSGSGQPFHIPGAERLADMNGWKAATGESGSTFSTKRGPTGCG